MRKFVIEITKRPKDLEPKKLRNETKFFDRVAKW